MRLTSYTVAMTGFLGGCIIITNLISPTYETLQVSNAVLELFSFTKNLPELSNLFHLEKII